MGTLYGYNSNDNTVTKAGLSTFDQFSHEGRQPFLFWVDIHRDDDKIEIYNENLECMILLRDQQTEEQAVILFATMIGLREQAAD